MSWAAETAQLTDYVVEFFPKPGSPFEVLMREFGMEAITKLPFWRAYSLAEEVKEKGQVHKVYTRLPWDLEFLH
jgi:hypothetical protein